MKMIGLGESFEGLYHLILKNKDQEVHATYESSSCCIPEHALWHFRLGYLFPTRMQTLHSILPFIVVDKNAACDVCHFFKHKDHLIIQVLLNQRNLLTLFTLIVGVL